MAWCFLSEDDLGNSTESAFHMSLSQSPIEKSQTVRLNRDIRDLLASSPFNGDPRTVLLSGPLCQSDTRPRQPVVKMLASSRFVT